MHSHQPHHSIVQTTGRLRSWIAATVQQARRATRSGAAAAERGMAGVLHTASTLVERAKSAPRLFEQQEFDGVVVAVLLAIVSIGYGSFLAVTWRQPVDTHAAAAPTQAVVASTTGAPVAAPVADSLTGRTVVTEPLDARRAAGFLSPRSLTALWKRRDTRSLEQAFTGLRQQTLAFPRCGMRKTSDDRAVARCEGSGSTWTIDFQRQAGRWQIANVVTR